MPNNTPKVPNSSEISKLPGLLKARVLPIIFLFSLLGLLGISLTVVYSATIAEKGETIFYLQARWIIIGMITALIISFLPLEKLMKRAHWGLLLVGIPLAYMACASIAYKLNPDFLNFFPFVPYVKGAVRWIRVPLIGQVQPSELSKVALIFFLASYYGCRSKKETRDFLSGVLIPGIPCGIILILILLGHDLSTTVITGLTIFLIMFIAGVRLKFLVPIVILGFAVGCVAIATSPERQSRITSFRNPEQHKNGDAYQLWRSVLSLGNGGLRGHGAGAGTVKTFLPEAHTDFIIAVIGEEFGFFGIFLVFFLYTVLCTSIVFIGQQCRLQPDMLLCMGISAFISIQALINIGVVSSSLPTTGVTAPFISYGGTSMLVLLAMAGIVLNISRRNIINIWHENISSRFHLTYRALQNKRNNDE